jgi:hypothetical protein
VCRHLRDYFPDLLSYTRFVALMPSVLIPLCVYLQNRKGTATGLAFIDATSIVVCHNRRIHSHKVFKKIAKRGTTSIGWFYGFKLHLVVNERGELLAFYITPGNVDDRKPVAPLTKGLTGKLFGDKGYISKVLFEALLAEGLQLIIHNKFNDIVVTRIVFIQVASKEASWVNHRFWTMSAGPFVSVTTAYAPNSPISTGSSVLSFFTTNGIQPP